MDPARPAPALAPGNNRRNPACAASPRPRLPAALRRLARTIAIGLLAGAAACGPADEPVPEATPYADPGFVEAGGWRLHYALTASGDLPSAIAGSYGIEQRPDRAVLVIALEPIGPGSPRDADAATAEADAVGLTGEREAISLRRSDEAGRPTWIASVAVRRRVPVTIEIRARATREAPELRARLTREFRFD